jgi:hypothetical protein
MFGNALTGKNDKTNANPTPDHKGDPTTSNVSTAAAIPTTIFFDQQKNKLEKMLATLLQEEKEISRKRNDIITSLDTYAIHVDQPTPAAQLLKLYQPIFQNLRDVFGHINVIKKIIETLAAEFSMPEKTKQEKIAPLQKLEENTQFLLNQAFLTISHRDSHKEQVEMFETFLNLKDKSLHAWYATQASIFFHASQQQHAAANDHHNASILARAR